MRLVCLRPGQDDGVRGGAEAEIGAVQLEPGRAAAGQPLVADDLARDPVPGPLVSLGRQAAVMGPLEQALPGEPDPGQHLRRAAVAAPKPAITAVQLVVAL